MGTLRPVFPEAVGEFVEFEKDGRGYRLLHDTEGTWVIHQHGVAAENFELLITNRSNGVMDVGGRGHLGSLTAFGASEGLLFEKLF